MVYVGSIPTCPQRNKPRVRKFKTISSYAALRSVLGYARQCKLSDSHSFWVAIKNKREDKKRRNGRTNRLGSKH